MHCWLTVYNSRDRTESARLSSPDSNDESRGRQHGIAERGPRAQHGPAHSSKLSSIFQHIPALGVAECCRDHRGLFSKLHKKEWSNCICLTQSSYQCLTACLNRSLALCTPERLFALMKPLKPCPDPSCYGLQRRRQRRNQCCRRACGAPEGQDLKQAAGRPRRACGGHAHLLLCRYRVA